MSTQIPRDGPAEDEIEVTPAMIEAGVAEFLLWDGLYIGTADAAVCAIFKAMVALSTKFHN